VVPREQVADSEPELPAIERLVSPCYVNFISDVPSEV
jgi:hypothetical protein